MMIKSRPFDFR